MFISEDYFIYDGYPSYPFGLRFVWINQSPDTIMVAEKKYNYVKNKSQNRFSISKSTYEDTLKFDIELVSNRVLTESEVRQIFNLYFNKNQFKELYFPEKKSEKIIYNCIFTNVERIEGGINNSFGVVGFKAKIICDAPWGWTEEKIITPQLKYAELYEGSNIKGATFTLYNGSDVQDYIYPTVLFTISGATNCSLGTRFGDNHSCLGCNNKNECWGAISAIPKKAMIINQTDSKTRGTCIFAEEYDIPVVMNPANGIIKNGYDISYSATDRNLISLTNKKFVRLLPGENIFYVENIKEIKFVFKEAKILV